MIHYFKNAKKSVIDDSLEIFYLYTGDDYNLVIGNLHGFHGSFINHKSTKEYLVLSGNGIITIDGKKYDVSKNDFIQVPIEAKHSIEGNLVFALACTPPYSAETEEIV